MKVVPITYSEMAWRQCYNLMMMNPLAHNTYYSTLFDMFRSLLNDEHQKELDIMIKEIEDWLSDEFNTIKLQEAEIYMFQNMDLNSWFEVGGRIVTQQEVNQRLENIRHWLRQMLFMYMPFVRFTQPFRIE